MSLRDLFLTLFLGGCLPVALARPFVGAVVFLWLGLMNPHRLAWSYVDSIPWSMMFAIATLVGVALKREARLSMAVSQYRWTIIYVAWLGISTAFALNPSESGTKFVDVLKIQGMALVTLALLTTRRRVQIAALVATFSIAFFGVKGGIFTLMSGGSYRVWGPESSAINDNNHLAVALVMVIPMIYWASLSFPVRHAKPIAVISMLLCAVSIFGSHSRGALLAIITMSAFFVWNSNRRILALPLVLAGSVLALMLMPQEYWDRMGTIQTYETDKSAMGRINAWRAAIGVANARPTGGGFAFWDPMNFLTYGADPTIPYQGAHSIFFQSIGEHGWIGLVLYVVVLASIWRKASAVQRLVDSGVGVAEDAVLAKMVKASISGFVVGGAFLNLAYWDFPYYLLVAVAATLHGLTSNAPSFGRQLVAGPSDHAGSRTRTTRAAKSAAVREQTTSPRTPRPTESGKTASHVR